MQRPPKYNPFSYFKRSFQSKFLMKQLLFIKSCIGVQSSESIYSISVKLDHSSIMCSNLQEYYQGESQLIQVSTKSYDLIKGTAITKNCSQS